MVKKNNILYYIIIVADFSNKHGVLPLSKFKICS